MKIVVVGGVAAGASAATKARRTDENAEIIVFEKGPYVSFANCGLPYYVGGTIAARENLILVSPELFKKRFSIDVRVEHEVTAIDPKRKVVTVRNEDVTTEESYDKLILGMGGSTIRPNIPGIDLSGVYNVFTLPDADEIVKMLAEGAKSAVVIGGGFIGIETAEGLSQRGVKTTLVEAAPQLLNNFDPEFSLPVEAQLETLGIDVKLGASVAEISGTGRASGVKLSDGTRVDADLVILAVGVRPRVELATAAGIALGATGGVLVDAGMRTSVPDIYAAGDIVESIHLVSGKKVRIPLAGSANKQGRIAGNNAAGGELLFQGVLGTAIIKVGELTCARTGLAEKECLNEGLAYDVTYLYANSNAGYYPGADSLIIKIMFEKMTGRLLGAEIVGRKGVDKRIDVYTVALYAGLTVFDLEHLDLAYAPPYSSAKDPVIMSGMVAANIERGLVKAVKPMEAEKLAQQPGTVLLDVRTPEEFSAGHLNNAIPLPVDELRLRLNELDKNKKYLVYCGVGYRAYVACRILTQNGFDASNVSGGYWTTQMAL